MKIFKKLFKEQTTPLKNGELVKIGDVVVWKDSDSNTHESIVQARTLDHTHSDTGEKLRKGTLFIHNATYNPIDYPSAKRSPDQ